MAEQRNRPEHLQQRLERLIQAGIRINSEREIQPVLQGVADSAREVIGARYAALGILNQEGTGLSTFVASGLTPEEHARIGKAMRLCTATSFVGVPAVAVPTGMAGGLPQGVQVIAGFYREDLCLNAAAVIEARLGRLTPIAPRCR